MVGSKSHHVFSRIIYHAVCLFLCVIMLYPLLWMIFSSFKESNAVFTTAATLIPDHWTFDNYVNGWRGFLNTSFAVFFKNSLLVTIVATFGAVLSSVIIAFGFARLRFKGSKIWFACMMLTMMLPFQVLMVPQYLLFNKLGWVGSYLPLTVPFFFGQGFFIFLEIGRAHV